MSENIQNNGVIYQRSRRLAQSSRLKAHGCGAFTLTEMLVAISVVAIVTAVTIPAIYALRDGFNSSGADTLISAALSSAKAIAAKEQKYAGIRFACVPNPERPSEPGDQYIVFIIQDSSLPTVNGFRAANGVAPMKLPANQGVTDLFGRDPTTLTNADFDNGINDDKLWDATSFSIVFSPSGRLVTHDVRVYNKDGLTTDMSNDMVFNTKANVDGAIKGTTPTMTQTYRGMFYQDNDPAAPGLVEQPSRMNLLIYDKRLLKKEIRNVTVWSGYLQRLATGGNSQVLYINPYTGTIIENESHRNATK